MRRTIFEINEIPPGLRQYFEEIEVKCGAPWKRVVEKGELKATCSRGGNQYNPIKHDKTGLVMSSARNDGGHKPGCAYETTTIGWSVTCECRRDNLSALERSYSSFKPPLEPIPCTVLDIFGGAMTTSLVAAKLGRDSISIELNPEYCKMGSERIRKELGFLVDLSLLQC